MLGVPTFCGRPVNQGRAPKVRAPQRGAGQRWSWYRLDHKTPVRPGVTAEVPRLQAPKLNTTVAIEGSLMLAHYIRCCCLESSQGRRKGIGHGIISACLGMN